MQRNTERSLAGVKTLIEIAESVCDRYDLILCEQCASGQHADCGGKKSQLPIAGVIVLGPCQCTNIAHNSLRKKGANNAEGSND